MIKILDEIKIIDGCKVIKVKEDMGIFVVNLSDNLDKMKKHEAF